MVILTEAAATARKEQVTTNSTAFEKQAQCEEAEEREELTILSHGVTIQAHREYGDTFLKAMKKMSAYRNWVSPVTQERQYVKSQTDDILCIFHDLPFFFSQAELKLLLGYISPNHNVTQTNIT